MNIYNIIAMRKIYFIGENSDEVKKSIKFSGHVNEF